MTSSRSMDYPIPRMEIMCAQYNVHKRKEDAYLPGKTKVKQLLVVCQGNHHLLYLNRFIIYKSKIKLTELFFFKCESIIQLFI